VEPESLKAKDESAFLDAMCDDLNTSNALSVLYEENKNLNNILRNRQVDIEALEESYARLRAYEFVLGIALEIPSLSADDKRLYKDYYEAKSNKDFLKSDEYRNALIKKGLF
jgi:cysteinyl-tRNA synthetase